MAKTHDFDQYGRWAIVHPGTDDEYIAPMINPKHIAGKLEYEEAKELISELDDLLVEMETRT